jgi:hypothetical protein
MAVMLRGRVPTGPAVEQGHTCIPASVGGKPRRPSGLASCRQECLRDPVGVYDVMYRMGYTPWEHPGAAWTASLAQWLDLEQAEREPPLGRALDLGCGRGQATGRHMRRIHVPRTVMAVGARVARRVKPEIGSMMGMALATDRSVVNWDDAPLRERGICARPVGEAIAAMTPAA